VKFANSPQWAKDEVSGRQGAEVERYQLEKKRKYRLSLSGSERNHLFIKGKQGSFVDTSGISGMDSASDGRSIAIVDFDRDGFQDFLVASSNAPTLRIYRNNLSNSNSASPNDFMVVNLVGGNNSSQKNDKLSSRDAIGATVKVTTNSRQFIKRLSCGEGLAAQNSRQLIFGLANDADIQSVLVTWPTGTVQEVDVPAQPLGKILTVFEDGSDTMVEAYHPIASPKDSSNVVRDGFAPNLQGHLNGNLVRKLQNSHT